MDPMLLPKIIINWKPEGRKKLGRPRRTWKYGLYTALSERGLRVGEWNSGREWFKEVRRRWSASILSWSRCLLDVQNYVQSLDYGNLISLDYKQCCGQRYIKTMIRKYLIINKMPVQTRLDIILIVADYSKIITLC
jgi:hypothetical protein